MKPAAENCAPLSLGRFASYAIVSCAILSVFALCWVLRDVILLVFGAIVWAALIRAIARPLSAHSPLSDKWAVSAVVLLLIVASVGLSWLFGRQIAAQMQGLAEQLPRAIETVRAKLEGNAAGQFVAERLSSLAHGGGWLKNLQTFAAVSVATVTDAALIFFAGIYLAATPALYLEGFARLFPVRHRRKLQGALSDSGDALRRWLLGQVVSMASVGVLTGAGLWLVGAPLPLGLGILAGLLEFIPVIGPVLSAVPGLLVAFTESPRIALYALIVYVAVQQVEGNIIMPLAQRWAVALPPAVGLCALLAFGLLFGFLGLLFGTPLAVVVMCVTRKLYVERGLEHSRPTRAGSP